MYVTMPSDNLCWTRIWCRNTFCCCIMLCPVSSLALHLKKMFFPL